MIESRPPSQPNSLGNTSLALGIASIALVFGIGLCSLVAANQGWIRLGGTPLYVCGASSAFLGLVASVLGVGGLLGANRPRATAIAGLLLGLGGICLFFGALAAIRGGLGGG
ncbi:MAG TPA: hypothetical protein VJ123_03480 [Anaerolineales bacterium]|nr:hypothetical protein [Anaerolineales bacterium]